MTELIVMMEKSIWLMILFAIVGYVVVGSLLTIICLFISDIYHKFIHTFVNEVRNE